MPLNNCSITTEELSGTEGTVSGNGIVNLTITPDLGYTVINSDGSLNTYIGGATEVNPNEWVGGNVTTGVIKVIFSNNGNNTINAAVHYAAIDWNFATDLYIDIDGKANQIIIDGDPVNDISTTIDRVEQDCTYCNGIEIEVFETNWDLPTNNGYITVVPSIIDLNVEEGCEPPGNPFGTPDGTSWQYQYEHESGVPSGTINPSGAQLNASHTFFVGSLGNYNITVTDMNETTNCGSQTISVTLNAMNSYSVNTFDIGGRGFGNELLPTASSQLITIQHGDLAEFELEVVDPGNGGGWYDFEKHTFTAARYVQEVKAEGSKVTRKTINFPAVSATAIYDIFLRPKGGTSLLENIPTEDNPRQIYQRVNNTITVTFTSANSEWGTFGNFTVVGRPNKKPVHSYNGPFTNKDFSITAALTLGGKTATAISGINKGSLSLPQQTGTIVSYRGKKDTSTGFIPNKFEINNFKSVLSGTTLTVTGKFNVEQFGSLSETITINIDKLFSVA